MGAAVTDGFDFSPGAQVPLAGSAGQTAATYALAAAAYRDDEVTKILNADNEWHQSKVKPPRPWAKIFRPRFGEAFSRAIIDRMLGAGRNPVIQSFGIEPQVVVEHCLAAHRIRRDRDNWLSAITVICGVLFLPGFLVWLLVFTLRTTMAKREDKRAGCPRHDPAGRGGRARRAVPDQNALHGILGPVRARGDHHAGRRLVLGQADLRADGP